jgi:DNA-binding transcriptional regulator GbsR (MarR family)
MDKEKQFIEEFALYFEQSGFPRMPGRILAWLLICDPPHQSINQLVKALHASKSSVSTGIKHLIEAGFAEKMSFPGVRCDYVRLRPHFDTTSIERFIVRISGFGKFAERWLSLLNDLPLSRLEKLKVMKKVNEFMGKEISKVLKQWEGKTT